MIDQYRVLFNKAYESLTEQKDKKELPPIKTYKFKDDVRILTTSPEVVDKVLTVHNLSHYKNTRITHEVNIAITIPIEYLLEEVEHECEVISHSKVEQEKVEST